MSKNNGNMSVIEEKIITVELTTEEIKLLIQIVNNTPLQGNMQALTKALGQMADIQQKLSAAMKI